MNTDWVDAEHWNTIRHLVIWPRGVQDLEPVDLWAQSHHAIVIEYDRSYQIFWLSNSVRGVLHRQKTFRWATRWWHWHRPNQVGAAAEAIKYALELTPNDPTTQIVVDEIGQFIKRLPR